MLLLANGCSCSELSVHPSNWNQKSADISLTWYISYWFYDPLFKSDPKIKGKKQVIVKGMNGLHDLHQRQDATEAILEQEKYMLTKREYNPITGHLVDEPQAEDEVPDYIIAPDTPFCLALTGALDHLNVEVDTKAVTKSVVNKVIESARKARLDRKSISEIRRRHILAILKICEKTNPKWSANLFNVYRSNLMMIYKVLLQLETVEFDPVKGIIKQKKDKKIRETLTKEQRATINEHLQQNHYRFWIYLQIFFHSGSRTKELFRLQGKAVDLQGQRFRCVIKKRGQPTEVWRPIKDIALQFWTVAMEGCAADDYVFSRHLKPGPTMIRADQISKRWNKYVKKEKGITADFYSLKHSNLDETAEALSILEASKMAGHTTPVITMDYATGEKERQDQRLKKVNNSFA